jgi:hypothetical protein
MLDTPKATEVMEGVIAMHDADLSLALTQKFDESSSLGESFSMRDFIVETVGEAEMEKIETKYLEVIKDRDVLMPGAKELIEHIQAQPNVKFGIMTYGSIPGQMMKIKGAGLGDVPALISMETYKGALIAGWRRDDDLYHLPEELGGFTAETIVFIDDKPFSFKGLPIDCRGYLVKSIFDAGIEKVPSYVTHVTSLKEVIAAEKRCQ